MSVERTLEILRADVYEETADAERARLGRLFDRYQARLYGLAMRLARDPEQARDLVQETFLRAARTRRLPTDEAAEAWLVRVLVNLVRDRWRRRRVRRQNAHERPVATPRSSPESRVVARETVRWALAQLPPRTRAVLVLRELEGLDTAAISRTLGMRPATVRWHLMEARTRLRSILTPGDQS